MHKFKIDDTVTVTALDGQYLYYNKRVGIITAVHLGKKDTPFYTLDIATVGSRTFYENELT